jgi:hypothetical protein
MICNNHVVTGITQAYRKALMADPTYKTASENLAIVLTDLGTSLKLSGHVQEGLAKYYDALKADSRYAVSRSCFIPYGEVC